MRFLFVTAGGQDYQLSGGHLSRCATLADRIRMYQPDALFCYLIPRDRWAKNWLESRGCRVVDYRLGRMQTLQMERMIKKFKPDVIIVDHLRTRIKDMYFLKQFESVVVCLDDDGPAAAMADVSINALLPTPRADYNGFDHLVLSRIGKPLRRVRSRAFRCAVAFGWNEPKNLAANVVKIILSQKRLGPFCVELFEGRKKMELTQFPRSMRPHLKIWPNSPAFFDRLKRADMAVVAGGLTMFECVRLGVPTGVLCLKKHQDANIRRMAKSGLVKSLGHWRDIRSARWGKRVCDLALNRRMRCGLFKKGINFRRCKFDLAERLVQIAGPSAPGSRRRMVWVSKKTAAIENFLNRHRRLPGRQNL